MNAALAMLALLLVSPPAAVVQDLPPPDPNLEDLALVPSEPDFTLAALPTTLRLPAGQWAFRVTHRFSRPLGQGDVGDLVSDFFGFDSGGLIGLELRYGLQPGTQLVLHRTSDRTMQLLGQQTVLRQGDAGPVGVDALAAVEGLDNFSERYTGTVGALISHRFGDEGAVYAQPLLALNPAPFDEAADDYALLLGLGARARVTPRTYLVAEFVPRLAGADPGAHHLSFGVERRAGGHAFQINVSNSFATTLGQVARGGIDYDTWFIGFNISRKFY